MFKKRMAAFAAAVLLAAAVLPVDSFAEMNSFEDFADSSSYAGSDSTVADEPAQNDIPSDNAASPDYSSSQEDSASPNAALYDISSAVISEISPQEYTGWQVCPFFTVTADKLLTRDVDYTVEYSNNTEPGTALITITGIGEYTGTVTASFDIVISELDPVKTLKATGNTTDGYTLLWSSSSGASGYELSRYDSVSKKWTFVTSTADKKYEVKNLASAQKSYYRIRAYRTTASKTVYSGYTYLRTATKPDEVKNLKITDVKTTGYTLKWSKVKGADKYQVYIYNASKKEYRLYTTVTSNKAVVADRSPGQKNTYKVRAVVTYDGKSYNGKTQKRRFTTKPGQVKNFAVKSRGKGYITFRWDKVKNASKYQLYYAFDKNGAYTLCKEISAKQNSVKTGLMPSGRKLYFKIRAVSKIDDCVQNGKCSSKIQNIAFNRGSINSILNGYVNSYSVKQVNSQGYALSDYNRSRLLSQLTSLGGSAGYILYDIDSGSAVAYNANSYFETASTVKMPYILYCLREMEDGSPTMNTLLTYRPSDFNDGSSWIKTQPFYTQYSINRVIELIGDYSDNCGYYMLQDYFGYSGYNDFIASLGCRTSVSSYMRWGYVSACDSAREWENMWSYMKNGRYASFAKDVFSTSCASNIRDQLGNRYTVYEKSGWRDDPGRILHNETALVRAEHPYIVICLTDQMSSQRMRNVAEISEAIHNEMWNYYNK